MITYSIHLLFYSEHLSYEIKDDVAVITFDTPDSKVRLKILFVVTGCAVFKSMVKIIADSCPDYYAPTLGQFGPCLTKRMLILKGC